MWGERSGRLYGRDAEIRSLVDLLETVRRGPAGVTVVVEGEAGIGKSALLSLLAARARDRGVRTFRGPAHPLERSRPFGPVIDALGLRPDETDERRAAVARLLAGNGESKAAPLGPGQLEFLIVEGIVDLLESLTDEGPALLELDDLHWAEGATLLTVERVMRRLRSMPLMLVLAMRPAPRSADLLRVLDDADRIGALSIRLDPLLETDTRALAEAELGAPLGPGMSAAVLRSGGSPLWLVELLRSLAAEDRVDLSGGVAELRSGELPGSIRELVIHRLRDLPERSVTALRTASLLGESFSLTDMAAVTGRRVTELVDDIGPAFTAGLVADHRGILSFRHQLVRDAIYESLPEGVRVALHRAAADALAASGAAPEKVAAHLMLGAASPDPAAAAMLREVAKTVAHSAAAVAADLLHRAAELLPVQHPDRDRVLLALAECVQRSGDIQGSIEIAEEVLARPHETAITIPLRFVVISGLSIQRRGKELIAQTAALLEDPSASESDRAHVLGLSGTGRLLAGDPRGGELDTRRGLEIAESAGDRSMMSWNLTVLGSALITQGRYGEAIESTTRATEIARDPSELQARRRAPQMMRGMALSHADRFREAAAAFRMAAQECAAVGSWMLEADIQLLAAEIRLLQGEWQQAVTEIEGGIQFARERNNLITLPRFCGHLALVCSARGDVTGGEALLGPFTAELDSAEPCFGAEFLFHSAAMLAEVAGHRAAATDILQRFLTLPSQQENLNGHRFITPALARLALELDRPEAARDAVKAAEHAASVAPEVPSVRGAVLRCRGLVESDPQLMSEAVRLTEQSGRVLEHAGACEDAASVLAARGDVLAARGELEVAIERYRTIDAGWLAARATAAYRTLGGRRGPRGPRSREQTGWQSLTRSELAVAELVAEGLTNREIGARLFISPHTVNSHLRHAFQKLGVSTRAGLASAAAAHDAGRDQAHSAQV